MIKTIFITCISLVCFGFTLFNNLDESNGIELYKFGTSPEKYAHLELEIVEGNTKLFNADPGELKIDSVVFSYVRLTFIKNQLSTIAFATRNNSLTPLMNYLKNKFGTPVKNKNEYVWKSTKLKLLLEPINNHQDAAVNFYSK